MTVGIRSIQKIHEKWIQILSIKAIKNIDHY